MSVNGELVGAEQTANNRVHEKSAARHITQITGSTNPVFVWIITRHSYLTSLREQNVTKLHNPKQNQKYAEKHVRVVFKWPRNLVNHRTSRTKVRARRATSWADIDLAIWSFIRWYNIYYWWGGEDKNVLDVTFNMTTL